MQAAIGLERSLEVFISYAHADQELRKKLEQHLSGLIYSRKITIWQDQEIPPGANWKDHINTHLNEADMILLLVSASFIASKYCWSKEMQVALERHKAGTVWVIPIILSPVFWQNTPLGQFQALPTGAKPVTQWDDQDAAFEDIVRGIQKAVDELRIEEVWREKRMLVDHVKDLRSLVSVSSKQVEDMKIAIAGKKDEIKKLELKIKDINDIIEKMNYRQYITEDHHRLLEGQLKIMTKRLEFLGVDHLEIESNETIYDGHSSL